MADESYLPPVVVSLTFDTAPALAEMAEFKASMADMTASLDADTAAMGRSVGGTSDDLKDLGENAAASDVAMRNAMDDADKSAEDAAGGIHSSAEGIRGDLEGMGESAAAGAAGVHTAADETRSDLEGVGAGAEAGSAATHDAAESMRGDLEGIGASAAVGARGTEDAMKDAGGAVDDAEKDVEDKSSGFSSRVSKVFTSVGSSMGNWGIPFGKSVEDMGSKIDEAETKGHGFSESLVSIGKVATVAGAAVAVGFGVESVKAAERMETAMASLKAAVKSTGVSFGSVNPSIEKTVGAMTKLGFTGPETAQSLTALTTSTKSVTTAEKDEALAADLARFKHIGLAQASSTLAQVYAGSNRAITKLGLNLNIGSAKLATIETATQGVSKAQTAFKTVQDEVSEGTLSGAAASDKLTAAHESLSDAETKLTKDQGTLGTVMGALEQRLHGQADAYGKTLPGQMEILGAELDALEESFGKVLIPILKDAAGVLVTLLGVFTKGGPIAIALGAAIAGPLAIAIGAYMVKMIAAAAETVSTSAEMVAGWASTAASAVASAGVQVASWIASAAAATAGAVAIDAATLGIVAGIALLVVGIIYLATHWKEVWSTITSIVSSAFDFIKSHIMLIVEVLALPLAPLVYLAKHWQEVWSDIKAVVNDAVTFVKNLMATAWNEIKSVASTAWNAIAGIFPKIWDTIKSVFSSGVSAVVGFMEGLPGKVMSALKEILTDMEKLGSEMVHALVSGIESAPGAIISAIKGLIPGSGVIGSVAGALGLATGGIVTQPTLAIVGEAGPEAVVPLNSANVAPQGVQPLTTATQPTAASPQAAGLHIGQVTVFGNTQTNAEIVQALYEKIRPMIVAA